MDFANTKPHQLLHPHAVINAHPISWTPYAKFQPVWSMNEFLVGIMMGVAMNRPHPLTHRHVIDNAYPVAWEHTQISVWLVVGLALIAKTTSSVCGYGQPTTICG